MTRIASFMIVMLLCIVTLAGCAPKLEIPATNAAVTGNGGLAVQKGQYLYFVNGYQSTDDLTDGDNKKDEKYAAIYRTKLGENNTVQYTEDGELENYDIIVDKICGFEKTGLFIFGDYIYYATPNTEKVIDGEIKTNFKLTDFYRAKLDGTERKHIYKTNVESDNTKFAFYKVNGYDDVYLALYDGTKLVIVNCSTNNVNIVCANAESVVMPKYDVYNADNNQISKGASNIYYTRAVNEDETVIGGNVMCYAKIGENTEHVMALGGGYTYSVIYANNDALVFSRENGEFKTYKYAIKYAYDQNGEVALNVQNGGVKLSASDHETVYLCTYTEGNFDGIVTTNESNKLLYINYPSGVYEILNDKTTLTPLAISGNYVYAYDGNNSLYQINYKTKAQKLLLDTQKDLAEDEKIQTPYFSATKNFSVCGTYVYYFATYEGNEKTGYYLNRISTLDKEVYEVEFVGVLQDEHIKTETEEAEEIEE